MENYSIVTLERMDTQELSIPCLSSHQDNQNKMI